MKTTHSLCLCYKMEQRKNFNMLKSNILIGLIVAVCFVSTNSFASAEPPAEQTTQQDCEQTIAFEAADKISETAFKEKYINNLLEQKPDFHQDALEKISVTEIDATHAYEKLGVQLFYVDNPAAPENWMYFDNKMVSIPTFGGGITSINLLTDNCQPELHVSYTWGSGVTHTGIMMISRDEEENISINKIDSSFIEKNNSDEIIPLSNTQTQMDQQE